MRFDFRDYPEEVPEPSVKKSEDALKTRDDLDRNPDRGQEEWDLPARPADEPDALDAPYRKPFEKEKVWFPWDPKAGPSTSTQLAPFLRTLSPAQKAMKAAVGMLPLLGTETFKDLKPTSDLRAKLGLVSFDGYLDSSGNPRPSESMAIRTIAELIDHASSGSYPGSRAKEWLKTAGAKSLATFVLSHPEAGETIKELVGFQDYWARNTFNETMSKAQTTTDAFGI